MAYGQIVLGESSIGIDHVPVEQFSNPLRWLDARMESEISICDSPAILGEGKGTIANTIPDQAPLQASICCCSVRSEGSFIVPGVSEKRGAGAGCGNPPRST